MKKFLITTACTLAVSLIGTFASPSVSKTVTDHIASLSSNQSQQKVQSLQAPATDKTTANEAQVTENNGINDTNTEVTSAQAELQATAEDTNNQAKPVTTEATDTAAKKAVAASTANKSATPKVATTTPSNKEAAKTEQPAQSTPTCSYKGANGETITVENVDLSNCNSVQDVVKTLQQNGCLSKNGVNAQNVSCVQDVQALLQSKACQTAGKTVSVKVGNCPLQSAGKTTGSTATTTTTGSTPTQTAPTTTTPPSTTSTGSANSDVSSYAAQVLQLVNAERGKQGLSALTTTSALTSAADKRATETAQSFSHTRPNGSSFSTIFAEFGISYSASGENIAYGQRTPQEVVTGWMNSPGHRANILNSNFNKMGVGVYQASNGTIYWTQEFTN